MPQKLLPGGSLNKTLAIIADFTDTSGDTGAAAQEPRVQKPRKSDQEHATLLNKKMGRYFRKNWRVFADALIIVAQDPASKPSERVAAAKTALEFGFGRASAQAQAVPIERPKVSFDGLPSVADMKQRAQLNPAHYGTQERTDG